MRAAVVDIQTNIVVNIIVADAAECAPPDGCFLLNVDDIWCDIDASYDPTTNAFIDNNPPALPETVLIDPDAPVPPEPVV